MEEKEIREKFCPYCGGRLSGLRSAGDSNWIHCFSCRTNFTVYEYKDVKERLEKRRSEVPQGCFEQMP